MEDYDIASKPQVDAPVSPSRRPMPQVNVEKLPYTGTRNAPPAIIASWIALEALSPQTYRKPADLSGGDATRVVGMEKGLPWMRQERSRPGYQLYYQLILGSIPADRATSELSRVFGIDEERSPREREKASIAAVLVDRDGLLLEENGVAISSFAWALPIALSGKLASLGSWDTVERDLVIGLTKVLTTRDQDGKLQPLTDATIHSAFQWLLDALALPDDLFEAPSFAIRVFHSIKAKNPPEVDLLNSFFLSDLSRAASLVESGKAGKAIARYVGQESVAHTANLLKTPAIIEALLAPYKFPLARWPAPGGHPLVTLQQAAVNAARSELSGANAGIVAVNGPPGTGKTTLLRDVVAACVLDRATAMVAFEDPQTAFVASGQKISAGGNAFLHLYRIDDTLKGHEVLVASSNNKAVENVSKELPAASAVGNDIRYFKSVSDRLLSKKEADGSLSPGEDTWGLIAAVLGNATNRSAFQQAVWFDNDRSLRLYLKAAKGDSVLREIKDEEGRVIRRETPSVVVKEMPPSPEQAKAQWTKARAAFRAIKVDVEAELQKLESVRHTCLQLSPARHAQEQADVSWVEARSVLVADRASLADADAGVARAISDSEVASGRAHRARLAKPGWLSRLFRTKAFRLWLADCAPMEALLRESERALARAIEHQSVLRNVVSKSESSLASAEMLATTRRQAVEQLERAVAEHRDLLGGRMVDDRFFDQSHEAWNLTAPWVTDAVHRKREQLFEAAMDVHRTFIGAAAQRVSHNLGVLMNAMQAGAFKDEAKRALLGDLWSTAYMVVPVFSTTFASVTRMLGDLPPASLGWLLIDEAGQATPQSAVGAIMRTKRSIVVGDPLQIPPVVSLPQRLVVEVARHFNIDPDRWLAPDASVQTVADASSRYQAEFGADVAVREVGIPLLVHRRCQEPMFGMSNQIAYDGQMVHAAGSAVAGPIAQTLGPSCWFNVDGDAESKWCPHDGELVVTLLRKLATSGIRKPSLYIITPFRIVATELRRRLEQEPELFVQLGISDLREWLSDRVGTIHTFQGKEAEAVIAVLGAPKAAQQGARRWAAGTPNILNVMVSRAKNSLYVVGSRAAWGSVGYATEIAGRLPVR
jgi:hypothetical protein